MRTTPLVGRKAWFGPRRMGWGLGPVSPEGWAVVAVGVVVIIGAATLVRHSWWPEPLAVVVLLAVIFLKGTPPGGARQWREFQASRGRDDS